jgi:hypothetical protein
MTRSGATIPSIHLEVECRQQTDRDTIVAIRELIDSHYLCDVVPVESPGSGRVGISHKKTHSFEVEVAYGAKIKPVATDVQRLQYFTHRFRSRDRWSHANETPQFEPGLTTFFQARRLGRVVLNGVQHTRRYRFFPHGTTSTYIHLRLRLFYRHPFNGFIIL